MKDLHCFNCGTTKPHEYYMGAVGFPTQGDPTITARRGYVCSTCNRIRITPGMMRH